jgi:hypothetical protein
MMKYLLVGCFIAKIQINFFMSSCFYALVVAPSARNLVPWQLPS